MNKYNIGLFHGRFEHIHKGHQKVLKIMFKECKKVVLLIGNSQAYGTYKDPFNVLERVELIKKIYGNKKNFIIGFFPDLKDIPRTKEEYARWGEWILSFCRYYSNGKIPDIVYSGGEAKTELLYGKKKIKIKKIPREELPISATETKELLRKDKKEDWKLITDERIHSEYNRLRRIVLSIPRKK